MQRDSYHVLERWSKNCPTSLDEGMTICIVTHGLSLRLFLMRWFQYTVHEFERSYNPKNGRVVVMKPACGEVGFELSEVDRIAMGFPLHREQERFRLMDDYSLLDESRW
jgi:broad specificity phosphatase PhoE